MLSARAVLPSPLNVSLACLTHFPAWLVRTCLPARPPACHPAVGESEYFVALLPDGGRLVHPIAYGERFPLNYGREVLAELAGVPHRCVCVHAGILGALLAAWGG